jgi:probable phosphoglycerate mutase
MKLLIIRHGDPDYTIDSLTEKGWKEAKYLSEMLSKMDITQFYTSPYGRAKDTASVTLKKLGRTAEVMPWLKEFDFFIDRPDDKTRKRIPWDWLPQDWTQEPRFYDKDKWFENERMAASDIGGEYRRVAGELDTLLAKHGYVREGNFYRAERPNHDTIALFCHFGVESVLLSHLFNVSPMVVWHNFCAQPSSVTTLVTEERREGVALFRMLSFGDISHLYAHDEPPAFAARFCECYGDETRHD